MACLEFLKAALPLFQIRKNALDQYAKINFDDQQYYSYLKLRFGLRAFMIFYYA